MKPLISMIFFFISCITFPTYTMELDKLNNYKKSTSSNNLLSTINISTQCDHESPTKYQNNYVTLLPMINIQNNEQNLSERSPLPIGKKETNKKIDEYETIPLHDTHNIIEESSSQRYQTTENISLYHENKCRKTCFKKTLVGSLVIAISSMFGVLIWVINTPSFWTCTNRTHIPCWND